MSRNHKYHEFSPDFPDLLILGPSTNQDLLAAVKSGSRSSWSTFVLKYSQILSDWCGQWNATLEDSEDLVQETLLELFQKINDYKAKPGIPFRAWLRKVAYYRYLRIAKANRRNNTSADAVAGRNLADYPHFQSDLLCKTFMEAVDRIAAQEILEIACARIASRTARQNWEIFQKKELEGVPSKTLAEEFGISSNAVDVITFRVRKLIRAELEALDPQP